MDVVTQLFELFDRKGGALYFGEAVTEREHALQAAYLAMEQGGTDAEIAAALLHDAGHLLHGLPEDIAERGTDGRHETAGAEFLANHFPPAVVDPVRLHVAAKRYLCAVEAGYAAGLSPASRRSLELQGGSMSDEELEEFAREPQWKSAVRCRRWDDAAKVPGRAVPPLASYRPLLERLVKARA